MTKNIMRKSTNRTLAIIAEAPAKVVKPKRPKTTDNKKKNNAHFNINPLHQFAEGRQGRHRFADQVHVRPDVALGMAASKQIRSTPNPNFWSFVFGRPRRKAFIGWPRVVTRRHETPGSHGMMATIMISS